MTTYTGVPVRIDPDLLVPGPGKVTVTLRVDYGRGHGDLFMRFVDPGWFDPENRCDAVYVENGLLSWGDEALRCLQGMEEEVPERAWYEVKIDGRTVAGGDAVDAYSDLWHMVTR